MESILFPITALVAAWVLGALLTRLLIPFLEKKQFRQFVRDEGPQSHLSKTGTRAWRYRDHLLHMHMRSGRYADNRYF